MKTLNQTIMDQRVERLVAEVEEARTTAQYWKAEHLAGNVEIEQLRAELAIVKDALDVAYMKGYDTGREKAQAELDALKSQEPALHVGNLPTANQDPYPALGKWWVQLWQGDDVFARVYGVTPEEARNRAAMLAAPKPEDVK